MTVGDWVSAGAAVIQSIAIVGGVVWGYYKFVRGRTFARRAEIAASGERVSFGDRYAINVRVALKNTGTSDIPLRLKVIYVHSVDTAGWGRRPKWEKRALATVFDDHDWIEAQETIEDEVLVPLVDRGAEDDVLAYRIEFRVYEKKPEGGGVRWTRNAVIPAAMQAANGNSHKNDRLVATGRRTEG